MSSSKEGFTEDDQARIAEEVQGRVSARRSGLGFGGLNPPSQDASKSCTGSSWFHQNAADSDIYKNIKSDHDTTQGAFPWDGGERGIKVGGVSRKKVAVTIPPPGEALSASGPSSEREFPMIRDRDIEHRKGGNEGKRSRSRSVSRDRERKLSGRDREHRRRRDRSRSGSRDRGRGTRREVPLEAERERQRQRQRDRDRDRYRGRERTRDRTRDRDKGVERDARRSDRKSRSPARDTRDTTRRSHWYNISDVGIERRDGHHVLSSVDRKSPRKGSSSLPTAVDTKVAIKRRLQKIAAADASLKTGFTATVGGGAGWERVEMSTASDFFKSDEVAAKGGVASVAPEYEARLAEILAVEDEETMCLGDGILKNATSASAEGHPKSLDPSTRAHHDAIFAPKGSDLSQPLSISQPIASASPTGRMTSNTGGMGAAARARLALTGKLGGTSMDEATPVLSKAIKKSKEKEDRKPNSQDNGDKPLFKTLRVGDSVEARYTVDDEWYESVILQVIHGGFEIARYKVRYTEYSNEETLSWKRIRRVNSAPEPLGEKEKAESQPVAPTTSTPPESPRERQHKPVSSDKLSEQFAGMRPRSVKIETKEEGKSTEEDAQMEDETSEPAVDANVVNPSILSGGPGEKFSWKAKLKARKAAASGTAGSTNNVQNLPKKQVSLVPDFAAQKRERETDQVLDRSKWRAKVMFGIGNVKRNSS